MLDAYEAYAPLTTAVAKINGAAKLLQGKPREEWLTIVNNTNEQGKTLNVNSSWAIRTTNTACVCVQSSPPTLYFSGRTNLLSQESTKDYQPQRHYRPIILHKDVRRVQRTTNTSIAGMWTTTISQSPRFSKRNEMLTYEAATPQTKANAEQSMQRHAYSSPSCERNSCRERRMLTTELVTIVSKRWGQNITFREQSFPDTKKWDAIFHKNRGSDSTFWLQTPTCFMHRKVALPRLHKPFEVLSERIIFLWVLQAVSGEENLIFPMSEALTWCHNVSHVSTQNECISPSRFALSSSITRLNKGD